MRRCGDQFENFCPYKQCSITKPVDGSNIIVVVEEDKWSRTMELRRHPEKLIPIEACIQLVFASKHRSGHKAPCNPSVAEARYARLRRTKGRVHPSAKPFRLSLIAEEYRLR
jgi:hypothetical protein